MIISAATSPINGFAVLFAKALERGSTFLFGFCRCLTPIHLNAFTL
jgi:hypothetical protein